MLDGASDPRLEQDLVKSDILNAFPRVSEEDMLDQQFLFKKMECAIVFILTVVRSYTC